VAYLVGRGVAGVFLLHHLVRLALGLESVGREELHAQHVLEGAHLPIGQIDRIPHHTLHGTHRVSCVSRVVSCRVRVVGHIVGRVVCLGTFTGSPDVELLEDPRVEPVHLVHDGVDLGQLALHRWVQAKGSVNRPVGCTWN